MCFFSCQARSIYIIRADPLSHQVTALTHWKGLSLLQIPPPQLLLVGKVILHRHYCKPYTWIWPFSWLPNSTDLLICDFVLFFISQQTTRLKAQYVAGPENILKLFCLEWHGTATNDILTTYEKNYSDTVELNCGTHVKPRNQNNSE